MSRQHPWAWLAFFILLAGCASLGGAAGRSFRQLMVGTERIALTAGFSPDEAAQAKALCKNKCTRCHRFYDPALYGAEEWATWMRKMSKKSHLQAEQERLLSKYLETFRAAENVTAREAVAPR